MFRPTNYGSGTAVLDPPDYRESHLQGVGTDTLERPSLLERRATRTRIFKRIDPRQYTQPSAE